jgi:serine/threonine protein kinase
MIAANSYLRGLTDEDRQVVEAWLVEFDQSWDENRLALQARRLPPAGSPLRLAALNEMVKIDLERQWQKGRQVLLESYLKAYPELGTSATVSLDLMQAEYQVRQQFGATADLSEFARRFSRQREDLSAILGAAGGEGSDPPRRQAGHDTVKSRASTQSGGRPAAAAGGLPEQFGRYRIVKQLGQGGMGAVYLAHDTQLDRPVALKVPHFTAADGPDVLERFRQEARAAATLSHPNLCPVYDVGEINGRNYLTMAYIEGKPLSDYLRGDKQLPQRQVAALIRKLALALQEAHAKGVIHRDLKPSNIMFNQRKEPVIMDFGLARRIDKADARLTKCGSVLGTPAYMPPEQVAGHLDSMGPACDIYSLGVIMYEMLTGRLPFDGPAMSILALILTKEPEKPTVHRPGLDPQLEAICLKAMAKKVEERYVTAAEMGVALGHYLNVERQTNFPEPTQQSRVKARASPSAHLLTDLVFPKDSAWPQSQGKYKKSAFGQRLPRWLWIVAGGTVACLLFGIVILIQNKDGSTRPIEGPKDAAKGAEATSKVVDLLAMIDPKKHAIQGTWIKHEGKLFSPSGPQVRVQVPYRPPEAYRLEISAERTGQPGGVLSLGILVGKRQVSILLDGIGTDGEGLKSGLHCVDGNGYRSNETTHSGMLLRNGMPSKIVITVQKNGIAMTCDGVPIFAWMGDPQRLSLVDVLNVRDKEALIVASDTSFVISEFLLTPISGQGEPIDE